LTGFSANISINLSNSTFVVADTALGIHTSVYDNINGLSTLPGLLKESGVAALRYPGGGYADIFHWSVSTNINTTTPWWGAGHSGYMATGTDFGHFVSLVTNANAQAIITVDYGSALQWDAMHTNVVVPATNGQPQEAAAWVAYANANTNIFGTGNDVTIGVDALGNDWKTAGYWAMMRAAAPLGTDDGYNFLRIRRQLPVGIRYWEIGNETFGTGYYDNSTNGYSVDYAVAYNGTGRGGKTPLAPAFYGQKVTAFSQAMRAVDPTIKIGAVVSTPPGDYSWDIHNGQRWIPQVLAQCATNIDFVIAHWYPYAGNNDIGTNVLSQVGSTIPFMINGATPGLDSGTSSGLRDWINTYRPDGTNVQIFITEFNYMGSVTNSTVGPVNALFAADSYASWMELGVSNIDYLEMNKVPFLGDSSPLVRGAAFYGIKLIHLFANPGDAMMAGSSDTSTLRVHVSVRQDNKVGILLINEDPVQNQTANLVITNIGLAGSGVRYQFGFTNFPANNQTPSSGISTNNISGLGNSFSVVVPAYTMQEYIIPIQTNTPPALAPIADSTINVGSNLAFTASATDTNTPAQTLSFSLLSGSTNATLNSSSGAFSWRPSVDQADSTNTFAIKVADSGTPSLSATQAFTVIVNPLVSPSVESLGFVDGQATLRISGQAGPDYAVLVSTNMVDWSTAFITNSPGMPFSWSDTNSAALPVQFYRIKVGPPLP
jgi:hypothetical protein